MKKNLITAAAALFALPVISIGSTAANAYDYCRRDVTGHITGCGFDTMEQCEWMRSGIGGDSFGDPFLAGSSSAYAYKPRYPGSGTQEKTRVASPRSFGPATSIEERNVSRKRAHITASEPHRERRRES